MLGTEIIIITPTVVLDLDHEDSVTVLYFPLKGSKTFAHFHLDVDTLTTPIDMESLSHQKLTTRVLTFHLLITQYSRLLKCTPGTGKGRESHERVGRRFFISFFLRKTWAP